MASLAVSARDKMAQVLRRGRRRKDLAAALANFCDLKGARRQQTCDAICFDPNRYTIFSEASS